MIQNSVRVMPSWPTGCWAREHYLGWVPLGL